MNKKKVKMEEENENSVVSFFPKKPIYIFRRKLNEILQMFVEG